MSSNWRLGSVASCHGPTTVARMTLEVLWVAFGTGKHFRYIEIVVPENLSYVSCVRSILVGHAKK